MKQNKVIFCQCVGITICCSVTSVICAILLLKTIRIFECLLLKLSYSYISWYFHFILFFLFFFMYSFFFCLSFTFFFLDLFLVGGVNYEYCADSLTDSHVIFSLPGHMYFWSKTRKTLILRIAKASLEFGYYCNISVGQKLWVNS